MPYFKLIFSCFEGVENKCHLTSKDTLVVFSGNCTLSLQGVTAPSRVLHSWQEMDWSICIGWGQLVMARDQRGLSKFCCLGRPLWSQFNNSPHSVVSKYKLREHPVYLVGSRDICKGVNYVHSSWQWLKVSEAKKPCSMWERGEFWWPGVLGKVAGIRGEGTPLVWLFWSFQRTLPYSISATHHSLPVKLVFYSYFTDQESEAQGVKCPSRLERTEPGFKTRCSKLNLRIFHHTTVASCLGHTFPSPDTFCLFSLPLPDSESLPPGNSFTGTHPNP